MKTKKEEIKSLLNTFKIETPIYRGTKEFELIDSNLLNHPKYHKKIGAGIDFF